MLVDALIWPVTLLVILLLFRRNFADAIARLGSLKANKGDIIFLRGNLGSGKTTFARFFIKSLSIHNKKKEPKVVVSPTYSLIQNYDCGKEKTVCHVDLFRLKSIKEIQVIDFFEEIRDKITLIEWPEKVEKIFKEKIEINCNNNGL